MMAEVTVLHLSDIQFGAHHAFGRGELHPWDRPFEELAARLCDDLAYLRRAGCHPDVVVLSGDLTETGRASEFAAVETLVKALLTCLELGVHRLMVVPGNHDMDRFGCQKAWREAEQCGTALAKPYWPKWKPYVAFFDRLYAGTSRTFGPEGKAEPWTLFELDDLEVVAAGLNSTIAESHLKEDHYGWLTERQLQCFAKEMRRYRRRGWLRLGVLHHNLRPIDGCDSSHVRDTDKLVQHELHGMFNLILHGHTHRDGSDVLDGVPVFATGSAGVVGQERPEGLPNQYQVLQIRRNGITRWARRFDWDRRGWVGDTRVTRYGDDWRREHPHAFAFVDATFREWPNPFAGLRHYAARLSARLEAPRPAGPEVPAPDDAWIPVLAKAEAWRNPPWTGPIDEWLDHWLWYRDQPPEEPQNAEAVELTKDHVALIGPPGAGKRTAICRLARQLSSRWLADPAPEGRPLIPILVDLERVPRPPAGEEAWLDLLARTLHERPSHEDDALVAQVLRAGRVVLLVHGLERLAPPAARAQALESAAALLGAFKASAHSDLVVRNALVMTCSATCWPSASRAAADFAQVELLPLTPDLSVSFARRYHRALGKRVPPRLTRALRGELASVCDRPGPVVAACRLDSRMQRAPTPVEVRVASGLEPSNGPQAERVEP
jgi:3',5'-cyclic AMP phosphodiesterase CpdA